MINIFKHLLPNARAWRITIEKRLRQFFDGLTVLIDNPRAFFDGVYGDVFPETTGELDEWENQFALPNTGLDEQGRRDRLAATWKALGGQSPKYIEDTLRDAGFDVYVHEWWEPNPEHPTGGAVNGDVTPAARNPFLYLWDGSAPRQFIGSGHDSAFCGGDLTFSNSQDSPPGYPLVNKVLESSDSIIGSGHSLLYAGGLSAAAGATTVDYGEKQYIMPNDPDTFSYYLYISGESFPNLATVPLSRREEFETLCLKICPTEQWLGILVNYT